MTEMTTHQNQVNQKSSTEPAFRAGRERQPEEQKTPRRGRGIPDANRAAMSLPPLHITSEIGKLGAVLLHRPGREVENITPDLMDRLLFDDIPYLPIAQKEHDTFAQTLRDLGVEVVYLEDLFSQALEDEAVHESYVKDILAESHYREGYVHDALADFLLNLTPVEMTERVMAGVRKDEVRVAIKSLEEEAENGSYPFLLEPMPNLYFTRDPAAVIGDGALVNHMAFHARKRESLFMEYILRYHPRFAGEQEDADGGVSIWRDRYVHGRIEGGDVLVLNDHVVAIGVSERTSANAIEDVARALFGRTDYDTVIAISIPRGHATMHLDTVFTMINRDQFTVHPSIMDKNGSMDLYVLHPAAGVAQDGEIRSGQSSYGDGSVEITHRNDLHAVLKKALGLTEVDLIPTGNGDPVVAPREQWNDASNTFAVAPGQVVTYNRNYVSNELLREHGVCVHEIESSELSRGRGGPRCMTMPLVRQDVD
ncbi:arginine deiminase [Parascardovia denticolens]|uniref:arginine deiminase n=1 Tax=Parascardovia denticolens TaxID=78258 RepID=UPI00248E10FD|nr:arginine deiminase [Parascardovia denticolens]